MAVIFVSAAPVGCAPDHHTVSVQRLREQIESAQRSRDFSRLKSSASQLLAQFPHDVKGLLALGMAQRHLGETAAALQTLRSAYSQAADGSPERQLARREMVWALMNLQLYDDALRHLADELVATPTSRPAYLQIGQVFARKGRGARARAFFDTAERLAPADAEEKRASEYAASGQPAYAARFRARAHALRGEFAAGEAVLRAAIESPSPGAGAERTGLRVFLVEFLVRGHRARDALDVLAELASDVGKDHPDVVGWRAMALRQQGQFSAAADLWTSLVRRHPRLLSVWGPHMGETLLADVGDPEAAKSWLEACRRHFRTVEVDVLLARCFLARGQAQAAVDLLKSPSRLSASWKRARGDLWLAVARHRTEQLDEKELAALGAEFAHLPEYHELRASLLTYRGHPEGAEFTKEVREKAEGWREYQRRAIAALHNAAREKGEKAMDDLLMAAELRFSIGDRQKGIRLAHIAAWCAPRSPRPWWLLAEWLDRPGEEFHRIFAAQRHAALATPSRSPGVSFDAATLLRDLLGEREDG